MSRTIAHSKDKRSKAKKQQDFLDIFSVTASVIRSAKKAKVPRRNIYDWLKADIEFKAKYEIASEEALGALEDEAVRRAYEGTNKPVYQQGKKVGSVKEYSDTLLIVLLKARAPQKYKDRVQSEVSGPNGAPIQTETTKTILYIPDNKRGMTDAGR